MSIELVIAALMAVVAILVGWSGQVDRMTVVERTDLKLRSTAHEGSAREH